MKTLLTFVLCICSITTFAKSKPILHEHKTLNIPGCSVEFYDQVETQDGGIVFTGRFDLADDFFEIYDARDTLPEWFMNEGFEFDVATIVHKIDASGDSLWTHLYKSSFRGLGIDQNSKGELLIAGFTAVDRKPLYYGDKGQTLVVLKIDAEGTLIWSKQLASNANVIPADLKLISDDQIVILDVIDQPVDDIKYPDGLNGRTRAYRTTMINANGEIQWQYQHVNEISNYWYDPHSLLISPTKKQIVVVNEYGTKFNVSFDIRVLNFNGEEITSKSVEPTMGEWASHFETKFDISETSEGYVICGDAKDLMKGDEYIMGQGHLVMILDSNFNVVHETIIEIEADERSQIVSNSNDEIFVVGYARRGLLIQKFDLSLKSKWKKTIAYKLSKSEFERRVNFYRENLPEYEPDLPDDYIGNTEMNTIQLTSDGIITQGSSYNTPLRYFKVDFDGNVVW